MCGLSTKTTGQPSAELFPAPCAAAIGTAALPHTPPSALLCHCKPRLPSKYFLSAGWGAAVNHRFQVLSTACTRCLAGEADDVKFSVSEHSNTWVLLTKDILITKVEIIGSLALSGHGKKPTARLQGNQSSHSVAHLIPILSSLSCCYLPPAEEKRRKRSAAFLQFYLFVPPCMQEMDSKKLPIKL